MLANLKRRRIIEDSLCPICRQELETLGHVLWGCAAVREDWNQSCKKVQKMTCQSELFINIWNQLVNHLSTDELEEVVVTLRGIWTRRNEVSHGKSLKHPNSVVRKAREELVNYKVANQAIVEHQIRWIRIVKSGKNQQMVF